MNYKKVLILSTLPFLASCNFLSKREVGKEYGQTKKVARVHDSFLYLNELPPFYKNYTGKDSIEAVSSFREKWIKKKLLINKAEDELEEILGEEYSDIQKKVEEYRNTLLLNAYKDKLISGRIDTAVSESDILNFYKSDSASFLTNDVLLKGYFIKVPANVPGINDVKEFVGKEDSDKKIFSFCVRYAKAFKLNTWFPKQAILDESPFVFQEEKLPEKKLVEKSDTEFVYILYIFDKIEIGEASPIDYVKGDIRNLILSQRKVKEIEKLEEVIYNEGKKSGNVEIF